MRTGNGDLADTLRKKKCAMLSKLRKEILSGKKFKFRKGAPIYFFTNGNISKIRKRFILKKTLTFLKITSTVILNPKSL